jgi:hypothetical protein
MDTPLEVLSTAAGLIEHDGYCRGNDALDFAGKATLPIPGKVSAWSMTGALLASSRDSGLAFFHALRSVAVAVGARIEEDAVETMRWDEAPVVVRGWSEHVWKWEDAPGRTVEHVLRAFDRAKEAHEPQQEAE